MGLHAHSDRVFSIDSLLGADECGGLIAEAEQLFIHDTWHEGSAVTEGVKYVLRSDVLYGERVP